MVRFGFSIAMMFIIGGCTKNDPTGGDDTVEVLHALAATLTADHKPVCLDRATHGDSLAVFRAMMAAPTQSRQPLIWRQPQPLRPPAVPSGRQVFDEEVRTDQILVALPRQTGAPLSFVVQGQLNFAAGQLSLAQASYDRTIDHWVGAPFARPGWWFFNRLSSDCAPIYTVSNPVVARNLAFVTVKAGHWGTTYSFVKQGVQWKALGQWASWLY